MHKLPKIWIADDDEAIRIVLEEGLKSTGLEISTYADGELLIKALEEDKPDLIISDIKMPGMHGYDLLKHIKNNYENENLKYTSNINLILLDIPLYLK